MGRVHADELIDTGEVRIRVRVSGQGPPMLFVSTGWGPSVDLYLETMPQLAERFTVAWVDPRGTGDSDRPADGDYAFASFIRDFDAARIHLGWETCWVAGHSMGGFLAQLFAATHPDHCAGLLALCTYGAMDEQYHHEMQARVAGRSAEPWFEQAVAALSRSPSTDEDLAANIAAALPMYFLDQDALARSQESFQRTSFSIDAYRNAFAANPGHEVLSRLGKISVPSIIVAADGDFICSPPLGERIHLALAGSKFLLIEDSGHMPWLEQPDRFWDAVDGGLAALGRT